MEEIEVKAKELGWSPKEEFRGDPDKWIDAETYVKRGEELLPLLKATTRKQSEKISALEGKLTETASALKLATDAIDALKETTSKAALDKVREQKVELKAALTNARSEGDLDAELEIQEKLAETTAAIKEAERPRPKVEPVVEVDPNDLTKTPDWIEWKSENAWFGTDKRKTALSLGIADELRSGGSPLEGRAFFDKVTEELNTMLGITSPREAASKVEGDARGSSGGGGGNGRKSFADLPPDAKQACEKASSRVVGKGKAFATVDDWRKNYVQKYFEE